MQKNPQNLIHSVVAISVLHSNTIENISFYVFFDL